MTISTSRLRFIEITPFAGMAQLAACSPKPEPAASPTSSALPAITSTPQVPVPDSGAMTAALPMVGEKDAQAVALGYVEDATKADSTKFKNYVPGHQCDSCALYQGKVGEAAGACPLFAGKNVAAKGWCTSWVQKA